MVPSKNRFGGSDHWDDTHAPRDLLKEFTDQVTYNDSFLQQSRARELRGSLLEPEAERALAEIIEKNDQYLRELAGKIIADSEISVRALTAKALVLLRYMEYWPDDMCYAASRALAELVLQYAISETKS